MDPPPDERISSIETCASPFVHFLIADRRIILRRGCVLVFPGPCIHNARAEGSIDRRTQKEISRPNYYHNFPLRWFLPESFSRLIASDRYCKNYTELRLELYQYCKILIHPRKKKFDLR